MWPLSPSSGLLTDSAGSFIILLFRAGDTWPSNKSPRSLFKLQTTLYAASADVLWVVTFSCRYLNLAFCVICLHWDDSCVTLESYARELFQLHICHQNTVCQLKQLWWVWSWVCDEESSVSPDCVVDLECQTGWAHTELQENCELFFPVIPVLHSHTYIYFPDNMAGMRLFPRVRLSGHPDSPSDQRAAAPDPHCHVLHPNSLQLCFLKNLF